MERRGHGEPRAQRRSGDGSGRGGVKCRITWTKQVVLVTRGGGCDGVAAMAEMNQSVMLRLRLSYGGAQRARCGALAR